MLILWLIKTLACVGYIVIYEAIQTIDWMINQIA